VVPVRLDLNLGNVGEAYHIDLNAAPFFVDLGAALDIEEGRDPFAFEEAAHVGEV